MGSAPGPDSPHFAAQVDVAGYRIHTGTSDPAVRPDSCFERTATKMARENGQVPGLPRPNADGMPVPWVTFMLGTEDVWWATIDTPRLLRCQAEWLCQLCGVRLGSRAWVVVEPGGEIISGAALHSDCLTLANRWCPELQRGEYQQIQVDRTQILADNVPLDSFETGDAVDEWGSYGDGLRRWVVAAPDDESGEPSPCCAAPPVTGPSGAGPGRRRHGG